ALAVDDRAREALALAELVEERAGPPVEVGIDDPHGASPSLWCRTCAASDAARDMKQYPKSRRRSSKLRRGRRGAAPPAPRPQRRRGSRPRLSRRSAMRTQSLKMSAMAASEPISANSGAGLKFSANTRVKYPMPAV